MKKETIAIGLLVVAGIGAILYFLYQKGKKATTATDDAAAATAAKSSTGTADDAAFKRLVQIFKSNAKKPTDLIWLLDGVDERMQSGGIHQDYLIKGKQTMAGTFVAIVAAGLPKEDKLNTLLWDELVSLKMRATGF